MTYIYTLSDEKEIRYVGRTRSIKSRYSSHINESKLVRTHKEKWIHKVLSNGGKIIMEILDMCDDNISGEIESYWITQLKMWGFNLVNLTNGGDGGSPMLGKKHSDDTKRKMSLSQKGLGRKTSPWNKGLNMSNEFKEKIRELSKNRVITNETREKISKSLKGRKKSPMSNNTKLKISEKKKGKISPNKGRTYSDEIKLKMSLSKLGVKRGEKIRKKLSESKKIIWVIMSPKGDIMEFIGYNSFIDFVKQNSIDVSVTTLKSYGKNKNWKIIQKIKK